VAIAFLFALAYLSGQLINTHSAAKSPHICI